MIIVKLMGGLGNQMFQYAAGRRLAHVHQTELKLDISWFSRQTASDRARAYGLGVFNTRTAFASPAEIAAICPVSLFSRLGRLNRLMPQFLKRGYVREKDPVFDPGVLRLPDNVYLEGYWQSARYFAEIENVICQEFRVISEPDRANKRMTEEITARNSVSLHVRRGDYVSNPAAISYHGSCSPRYYQMAVKMVKDRISRPHFYIFSDDPVWVAENMTGIAPRTVVDLNGPDKAHEDMRLMSLCKHHIVANSSFSWWGAWLSRNADKIVIAPRQWFGNAKIDARDIVPETWIRI